MYRGRPSHGGVDRNYAVIDAVPRSGLVERVMTEDMLTAYCAQQADLHSHHRMLAAWSEASSEPELKSGIGRFLLAVDEIEADKKAVLGILAASLGMPWKQ